MATIPAVLASNAQQALFRQWAADTVFVLDVHDSPKRQFSVLAKLLNWVGGEEPWNTHWQECFGEEYIWRASVYHSDSEDDDDGSSFDGDDASFVDGGEDSSLDNDNVWSRFRNFQPDPSATFNNEFWRLSRYMRWKPKPCAKWRVWLFNADWEAHVGSDITDLGQWHEFCRLCSIDPVPETIPECMTALAAINVNIYDILDSKRTGSAVEVFDDFKDFRDYTEDDHRYPLHRAKKHTFKSIFLKKLYPKRQAQ